MSKLIFPALLRRLRGQSNAFWLNVIPCLLLISIFEFTVGISPTIEKTRLAAVFSSCCQNVRSEVIEHYAVTGEWLNQTPSAAGLSAIPEWQKNFARSELASIEEGAIHLRLENRKLSTQEPSSEILTLRPTTLQNAPVVSVLWTCGFHPPSADLVAHGVNRTTIPEPENLSICRSHTAPSFPVAARPQ